LRSRSPNVVTMGPDYQNLHNRQNCLTGTF
jgi:hypothetical protein